MRRYERDTKGSFLIQFRTEESRMVLSSLSIKSITHWYGKTCSIQTIGVFISRYCKAIQMQSACIHTHITQKHTHFFQLAFHQKFYIGHGNKSNQLFYQRRNTVNTQNEGVNFCDLGAHSGLSLYGIITLQAPNDGKNDL